MRFYFAFDTHDMPGTVKASYVEVGAEYMSVADFSGKQFRALDPAHPYVRELKLVLDDTKFVGPVRVGKTECAGPGGGGVHAPRRIHRDVGGVAEVRTADQRTNAVVTLGEEMIRVSFQALGASTRSDVATLSRVGGSWPEVLLDVAEKEAMEAEEPRRRFTSRQIQVAFQYCQIFSSMRQFRPEQKKAALLKVTRPYMSWRKIGKVCGLGWAQARDAYDSVVVSYVYEVAKAERVPLEAVELGEWAPMRGNRAA